VLSSSCRPAHREHWEQNHDVLHLTFSVKQTSVYTDQSICVWHFYALATFIIEWQARSAIMMYIICRPMSDWLSVCHTLRMKLCCRAAIRTVFVLCSFQRSIPLFWGPIKFVGGVCHVTLTYLFNSEVILLTKKALFHLMEYDRRHRCFYRKWRWQFARSKEVFVSNTSCWW